VSGAGSPSCLSKGFAKRKEALGGCSPATAAMGYLGAKQVTWHLEPLLIEMRDDTVWTSRPSSFPHI
jgi:hypothetical protein